MTIKSSNPLRVERDYFGEVTVLRWPGLSNNDSALMATVDDAKYWGASSQRSTQNFNIGGPWERIPLPIIYAGGLVKLACARVNISRFKMLDTNLGDAIIKAAQEVADGKLDDNFPCWCGRRAVGPKRT
jgi:fumarate hydratase class II